jgi:hypothetical protein
VNWYGAMAMRVWARWRPRAYAGISDPQAFFTELGEEVAEQVEEQSTRCIPRRRLSPRRRGPAP